MASWASQVVLVVKSPPAKVGDVRDSGLIPRSGRSPGGRHSNPLQYSCLENPMDRGAWWATAHWVTKGQTRLKQLSKHTLVTITLNDFSSKALLFISLSPLFLPLKEHWYLEDMHIFKGCAYAQHLSECLPPLGQSYWWWPKYQFLHWHTPSLLNFYHLLWPRVPMSALFAHCCSSQTNWNLKSSLNWNLHKGGKNPLVSSILWAQ